jgi:heat-inducible transcriptional repressor
VAMRYYIQNLMKPKDMAVSDEVAVKEKLAENKKEFQKMLSSATRELARRTKSLAVAEDNEENTYYSGVSNILSAPEFYDIDLTRSLLEMLDQVDRMHQLFAHGADLNDIQILMGEELGQRLFAPCGLVYTRFGNRKIGGTIGVLGPYRFNYSVIIPTVRYFGNTIDQMLGSW